MCFCWHWVSGDGWWLWWRVIFMLNQTWVELWLSGDFDNINVYSGRRMSPRQMPPGQFLSQQMPLWKLSISKYDPRRLPLRFADIEFLVCGIAVLFFSPETNSGLEKMVWSSLPIITIILQHWYNITSFFDDGNHI